MSKVELAAMREANASLSDDAKRTAVPPSYFTAALPPKQPKKPIAFGNGKGLKLSEISYVAKQIAKRENNDKGLQLLHRTMYGAPAKATILKRNVRQFNGVVYDANLTRAKMEARLENRNLKQLRDMARILGVEGGNRPDLQKNLLAFFEKPTETEIAKKGVKKTTKKAAKKAVKKTTKKAAKKTTKKTEKKSKKTEKKSKKDKKAGKKETKKAGKKEAKKAVKGPKKALTAYMFYVTENRPAFAQKNPNLKQTELVKKLAEEWKALSADKKKPFEDKAAKDRQRFENEKAKAK